MKNPSTKRSNALTSTLIAINHYFSEDFLGGPKVLKWAWVINFQKIFTPVYIALLMIWFGNSSTVAWIYLALHGTYSFCWLLKHVAFPDSSWEKRVTYGGAAMILAILLLYWIFPYMIISGHTSPANSLLCLAISLHTFGVVIMIVSDAQKHFTLQYHPGLITEGMYKYTRNPNYLGEMMLYSAYALLVQHWLAWIILAGVWLIIFIPNMLKKDRSLSRYPGWESYQAKSGMILPWPLTSAIFRQKRDIDL
jgi:protein-S-isoprenylcysteine O-methyltransferase Ste14